MGYKEAILKVQTSMEVYRALMHTQFLSLSEAYTAELSLPEGRTMYTVHTISRNAGTILQSRIQIFTFLLQWLFQASYSVQ